MKNFGVVTDVSHFKTLKNDKIASMIDVLPTFFKGFSIIVQFQLSHSLIESRL
jgi:hypothetical protein